LDQGKKGFYAISKERKEPCVSEGRLKPFKGMNYISKGSERKVRSLILFANRDQGPTVPKDSDGARKGYISTYEAERQNHAPNQGKLPGKEEPEPLP